MSQIFNAAYFASILALADPNTSATFAANQPEAALEEPALNSAADQLLEAIRKKDQTTLKALAPYSGDIYAEDEVFIYNGDQLRQYDSRTKSILEFLNSYQLTRTIVFRDASNATIYFVPQPFYAESRSNKTFFKKNFMTKYFACDFHKTGANWKLKDNFCFAQTEGPFGGNY